MQQQFNGTFWQSRLFDSKRNRIVMLAILVLSLVLGVASREALASSHNDPINGCYHTSSRTIRFADDEPCGNNEVALSWPSMNDFVALQVAMANEAAERQAADAALQAALAEEASLREAEDAELRAENAELVQQIADLRADLEAEANARQSGDTTLQTALNQEIANRIAGDSQTLAGAITHANNSVAKEATERQNLKFEMTGNLQIIVQVIGALMTADWDGAWQSLIDLAKERLPDFVWQTLESIGNMLGPIIENITATIDGVVSKIQEIWEIFFPEDPKEAN